MNFNSTMTAPYVWQNPIEGLKKRVAKYTASFDESFGDIMTAAIIIAAVAALLSGVLDLSIYADFIGGFLDGTAGSNNFFTHLSSTQF